MKHILRYLLFILPIALHANMAQFFSPGTQVAAPFISKYVSVVKEDLFIQPTTDFETAYFQATYYIHANQNGVAIPMLFYAYDYFDYFNVWVDGQLVALDQVPSNYKQLEKHPFADFDSLFNPNANLTVPYYGNMHTPITLTDLKFFTANLSKGDHVIKVAYNANYWSNYENDVQERSFRYALAPAKYWQSFGQLTVRLDTHKLTQPITTNLGNPTQTLANGIQVYTYNSLPADVLIVTKQLTKVVVGNKVVYPLEKPQVQVLMFLGPVGVAIITFLMLLALHSILLKLLASYATNWWYKVLNVLCIVVVPFLVWYAAFSYFSVLEYFLGTIAGHRNRYGVLFCLLLYVPGMPLYWFIIAKIRVKLLKKYS